MGKLWEDTDTEQLILNYNGILWGLKEKIHCRVRNFDGQCYVIPEICATEHFEQEIKPGMLGAKEKIEQVLRDRGLDEIPKLDLQMMTSEAADIKQLGWETYKLVKKAGLDYARQARR